MLAASDAYPLTHVHPQSLGYESGTKTAHRVSLVSPTSARPAPRQRARLIWTGPCRAVPQGPGHRSGHNPGRLPLPACECHPVDSPTARRPRGSHRLNPRQGSCSSALGAACGSPRGGRRGVALRPSQRQCPALRGHVLVVRLNPAANVDRRTPPPSEPRWRPVSDCRG